MPGRLQLEATSHLLPKVAGPLEWVPCLVLALPLLVVTMMVRQAQLKGRCHGDVGTRPVFG